MNMNQTELSKGDSNLRPEGKYDLHSEEYLAKLMSTQLGLSMKIFAVFLIILIGIPMANKFLPELMNTRMFGFTFSWFFLGFAFFPLTWIMAYVYVNKSVKLEDEAATWVHIEERNQENLSKNK